MTASLSNDDLDKLALESDARAGERVLAQLYEFLGRFVSYPSEHAQVAHALWCVHAHLMDKWESTPRLAFLSDEPASGIKPKTIRTGPHSTLRGYRRADFEDQWRRLLPPSPDRSATSKTDETSGPVADVLDVLDLPKKGGETVSQFRCAYCHKSGAVIQRAYGVALHRDCMVAWKAAHDDLEIPSFLDRRAGLLA